MKVEFDETLMGKKPTEPVAPEKPAILNEDAAPAETPGETPAADPAPEKTAPADQPLQRTTLPLKIRMWSRRPNRQPADDAASEDTEQDESDEPAADEPNADESAAVEPATADPAVTTEPAPADEAAPVTDEAKPAPVEPATSR